MQAYQEKIKEKKRWLQSGLQMDLKLRWVRSINGSARREANLLGYHWKVVSRKRRFDTETRTFPGQSMAPELCTEMQRQRIKNPATSCYPAPLQFLSYIVPLTLKRDEDDNIRSFESANLPSSNTLSLGKPKNFSSNIISDKFNRKGNQSGELYDYVSHTT